MPAESPRGPELLLGKTSGLISLHLSVYQDIGTSFKMLYCHSGTVLFYVIKHELMFIESKVLYVIV